MSVGIVSAVIEIGGWLEDEYKRGIKEDGENFAFTCSYQYIAHAVLDVGDNVVRLSENYLDIAIGDRENELSALCSNRGAVETYLFKQTNGIFFKSALCKSYSKRFIHDKNSVLCVLYFYVRYVFVNDKYFMYTL